MEIKVIKRILEANEQHAEVVRQRLREAGVVSLNLISAPGSGKTSLIEAAIRALRGGVRLGVIEGDPDTTRDAERIARLDVPVVQINTEGGCHLEATMVLRALEEMALDGLQLLFIENVGNLVCPVVFDLGETYRVAVVSAAEGHDKPAKYPALFRTAHVTVLNKIDLIPYLDFDEAQFTADVHRLNPQMPILRVSCRTGEGISEWVQWLEAKLTSPILFDILLRDFSKTGGAVFLIDTSDFRNGLHIIVDGDIYTILEFMHVKPGKGGAFVRTKLRNVRTGAVIDKTFRAGERMEQAFLERKPMQFLYNQDDEYYLMDMDTYDQVMVRREQFGEGIKYLKENMEVTVLMHEGRVVGVEIPWFVELQVVETDPGVRGDTASGGSKPATLETGAVVRVPFHINVGDIIKVDTRTDQYLERVKAQS